MKGENFFRKKLANDGHIIQDSFVISNYYAKCILYEQHSEIFTFLQKENQPSKNIMMMLTINDIEAIKKNFTNKVARK